MQMWVYMYSIDLQSIHAIYAHQTQASPSRDDPAHSEGNVWGPTKQHSSHRPEDVKAAMKLTLRPVSVPGVTDMEELPPSTDSPGGKSDYDGAPLKVCGCGLRFAGDQGREYVKHTLTCSQGSPVCSPKAVRHSQYFTHK